MTAILADKAATPEQQAETQYDKLTKLFNDIKKDIGALQYPLQTAEKTALNAIIEESNNLPNNEKLPKDSSKWSEQEEYDVCIERIEHIRNHPLIKQHGNFLNLEQVQKKLTEYQSKFIEIKDNKGELTKLNFKLNKELSLLITSIQNIQYPPPNHSELKALVDNIDKQKEKEKQKLAEHDYLEFFDLIRILEEGILNLLPNDETTDVSRDKCREILKGLKGTDKKSNILLLIELERVQQYVAQEISKINSDLENDPIGEQLEKIAKFDFRGEYAVKGKQSLSDPKLEASFVSHDDLSALDLAHAYSPTKSFNKGRDSSSQMVAETYENTLRLGLKVLILHAKSEIAQSRYKQSLTFESAKPGGIKKCTKVFRKINDGKKNQVLSICGDAPSNGGTKELYSVTTPAGNACLVGYRQMVKTDPANYCCYPLAALCDITDFSQSWSSYKGTLFEAQQVCGLEEKTDQFDAFVKGMHITISEQSKGVGLAAIRKDLHGSSYINNGSHTSIDIHWREQSVQGSFRVQFRPRVEISTFSQDERMLRSGRPVVVPLELESDNTQYQEGEFQKDKLPSSLLGLKGLLSRETHNGYLAENPKESSKKPRKLTGEQEFLKSVMNSDLNVAGQALICEVHAIGKFLQTHFQLNLSSSEEELHRGYEEFLKMFQDNKDLLQEHQQSLEAKIDVLEPALLSPTIPLPKDEGCFTDSGMPNSSCRPNN